MKTARAIAQPGITFSLLAACLACPIGGAARASEPANAPAGYERAVSDAKPMSYWRFEGQAPATGGNERIGSGVTAAQPGPRPPSFPGFAAGNLGLGMPGSGSTKVAGLQLDASKVGVDYTVEFWFCNTRPVGAEPVTCYLFGRDDANPPGYVGDNLGVGGTHALTVPGRLFFFDGDLSVVFNGTNDLAPSQWYHVAFVRHGEEISVHLNGNPTPEIHVRRKALFSAMAGSISIGVRPDGFGAMAGQLDEVALYDRPLRPNEIRGHYVAAAGQEWTSPPGKWRQRVRQELATLPKPAPLPASSGANGANEHSRINPIDALLTDWWARRGIEQPAACEDRAFYRRIHLDLIGLLPEEKATTLFVNDPSPDKRAFLIDRLLADDLNYAEHWITFWADLLRDDQSAYIAVARYPITRWLLRSLRQNKPYDEFVAELIDPHDPEAEGFVKGIDWNLSSSVSEIPPVQVAQVTAQVFQGVNLKCATCHDHFTKHWKFEQSWAFAGFFSTQNLQPHRCDKPQGQPAPPQFLFEGLGDDTSGGTLAAGADMAARRLAVSIMVTRPKNPRFARTIVNRLFKKLVGQGLIDATDDLDGRTAFKPELLDRLAYDCMAQDYNLKQLLRTIVTSRVYQMRPADVPRPADDPDKEPQFLGPRLRRLSAEQFLDSICCLTGHWPQAPAIDVPVPGSNLRAWRHSKPNQLAIMLGRSNREVVVSERPDRATMLQALEMVNGNTLNDYLAAGAKQLLASDLGRETDLRHVIDTLCIRAYARPATEKEVAAAQDLLGPPDRPAADREAGCQDLLWLMVVSPEFQYLY